jgi:murein DD-endopeptidase MepM/ murein hydrolase activator NlpD
VAAALSGCSADVTRFDFPFFGLTDNMTTGSLPTPAEPVAKRAPGPYSEPLGPYPYEPDAGRGSQSAGGYAPAPTSYGAPPARTASLQEGPRPPAARVEALPPVGPAAERAQVRPLDGTPRTGRARTPVAGDTIEVQPGDTLYILAQRYRVSMSALMDVNGLRSPVIKPGQKLVLPANAVRPPPAVARATSPAAVQHADWERRSALAASEGERRDWSGTYVMKPGDSLYGIARSYGVPLADLQRVNGITDPTKVRFGTALKVPAGTRSATADQIDDMPTAASPPRAKAMTPRVINTAAEPARLAGRGDSLTDADPPAPVRPASLAGETKFRWPAKGRLIATFGKRPDGTHNDGINIAVPHGTDIHAAEAGRVVYAGDEIKGYGNLILIRHNNGWVSAYAHADRILVRRNDSVRRGQVIATAGNTGQVDQPQVHFELRHGSRPVDPLAFLEKN